MAQVAADPELSLPAAGEVHLWLLREPAALRADESEQIQQLLSTEERQRWQRFHHEEDANRFLITRALQRRMLARYCSADPAALRFGSDTHGKPFLLIKDSPHATLRFNLSHTRGLCVLAVSNTLEVGVDVENTDRNVEMLPLAVRFFAKEEAVFLQSLPESELRAAFFRLWTLKEAYVKARGIGLKLGLDRFIVDVTDNDSPRLLHSMDAEPAHWSCTAAMTDSWHVAAFVQAVSAQWQWRELVLAELL